MAELTNQERLQPSLLDRLTDDEPGSRVESRDRRIMSMRQIRAAVMRDLEWLLNCGCRPTGDEIYEYPLVASSVLNYGMPDLTGLASSGVSAERVEMMVQKAIVTFEPRIVAGSVGVKAMADGDSEHSVYFQITGELCPLPMPEALFIRTSVDLETNKFVIQDQR